MSTRVTGHLRTSLLILIALVLGISLVAAVFSLIGTKPVNEMSSTQVVLVSPVNAHGVPKSGLRVLSSLTGTCDFGSLIVEVPAYRCFSKNQIFDPCWAVDNGHGLSTEVMCRLFPWSPEVEILRASGLSLVTASRTKPNLDDPFGVQLAGGQNCYRVEGAVPSLAGRPLAFECLNSNVSLFGSPNRAQTIWTIHAAVLKRSGLGYESPTTVRVTRAWIAWP